MAIKSKQSTAELRKVRHHIEKEAQKLSIQTLQESAKEMQEVKDAHYKLLQEMRTLKAFLGTIETILAPAEKLYTVRQDFYRGHDSMGERYEIPIEQRILKFALALKINFEREDESSSVETEKSEMLFNIVMASIKDEARLKEMDIEKEMILAGMVKIFHADSGKFSWGRPQDNH